MSGEASVRFTISVIYYDGRPNYLGDSRCTVTNGQRLVVEGGNGRVVQFPLVNISSVAEGRHSGGKVVDVTLGGVGVLAFHFPNSMQAYWLHSVLRDAMAGKLPDPVPDMPPGGTDRSNMWGNLGILFGVCFFPLGVLFGILSLMDAKKYLRTPTRAIIAFVVSGTAGICVCASTISQMAIGG